MVRRVGGREDRRVPALSHPRTLLLSAVDELAAGHEASARARVRSALPLLSRSPELITTAARVALHAGEYELGAALAAKAAGLGRHGVLVAFELLGRLGRDHEARELVERAIRARPGDAGLRLRASTFYASRGAADLAVAHLDRAIASGATGPAIPIERASLSVRTGRPAEVGPDVEAALGDVRAGEAEQLEAVELLTDAGEIGRAEAVLEAALSRRPESAALALARAARRLFRGDAAGVHRALDAIAPLDPVRAAWLRTRGAALVLERRLDEADRALSEALSIDAADPEALTWRGELRFRSGDLAGAFADLDRVHAATRGYSFPAHLVRLLAVIANRAPEVPVDESNWEAIEEGIVAICGRGGDVLRTESSEAIAPLLEEALARLGGNRAVVTTYLDDAGALARLPVRTSPRLESRRALERIRVASAADTLAGFDGALARFPRSSLPITHRGELLLWLGRIDDAVRDLEAAIAMRPATRWAWIGLTMARILLGDPGGALETSDRGIAAMQGTVGDAVHVHRGEAHRIAGRLEAAREDLERAVRLQPHRLSAWIDLALVLGASGEHDAQARALAEIDERGPTFAADARAEVAIPPGATRDEARRHLLEHMLRMMRGNRSASTITYFTADGKLRLVPRGGKRFVHERRDEELEAMARALRGLAGRPGDRA